MENDILSNYSPDKYPARVCCGMLEHFVANGYVFPFERPIGAENLTLKALGWAVNFFKRTPNGRIDQTKKGKVIVFIGFCPFCGHRLRSLVMEEQPPS